MRQYKILTLTDHSGHSDQNSIYALLKQMRLHKQCRKLYVASRAAADNAPFFTLQDQNILFARKVDEKFAYDKGGAFFTNDLEHVHLSEFDILFLRLPRPISSEFLLWLKAEFSHGIIINDPAGIVLTSNKAFLRRFPDLCPPIKLCNTIDDILQMAAQFPIVLKPLEDYGGRGLLRVDGALLDDGNEHHDTESYLKNIASYISNHGYLAMKFLKNVSQGDKRILVVGGQIIAASLRLPAEDSWLCNVARGGTSVASEVTDRERQIIEKVSPILLQEGVFIYGADTLTDDNGERILSELNTLSIGGFPQAEAQTGKPIIKQTINMFFEYADSKQ